VRRALDRVVDLGELARPNDIAFLPGSTTAIVTVEVPPHLVRIDAAGEGFTKFAIPHKAGHMLALSPDGRTAFVSHVAPGSLSFVDLESGESRANVPLPLGAEGIACTPDGRHVWVACNRSGSIAVVDAAERKVVRTLPCPGFPLRLRISPDGRTVAASCTLAGELALFSTAHPGEAARVALPDPVTDEPMRPTSIAFTPDGSAVVAVCDGPRPQLVRVDLARRAITHRLAAAGPIADALCTGRIAR
ncbi:MAG TPA: YncE family protein, partial [Planctomycetota bacterium]|nr:YncE family protein [Planctomycetota bacterium]